MKGTYLGVGTTSSVGVTRVLVVRHGGLIDKALFEVVVEREEDGRYLYLNVNRFLYPHAQRIS